MKNKLAIVIPYYKIDFFEETIKSVASQKDKNFSLYIGNDNSPDDPLHIIKKYLKDDEYKYFYYKENLGGRNLALQWERILENVKEEWFQILGDDDELPENFVESFYNSITQLDEKGINVIKFPVKIIDENNNCIRQFSFGKNLISRYEFLISRINHSALSSLSENIFRTKSFLKYKIQQFPLAWHSDDCMIFEYAENDHILYCKNTFVFVRMSEKNISSMTNNTSLKETATNEFYSYIIANYYRQFSSTQKKIILKNLKKHLYYSHHKLSLQTIFIIFTDNFIHGLKLSKYLL